MANSNRQLAFAQGGRVTRRRLLSTVGLAAVSASLFASTPTRALIAAPFDDGDDGGAAREEAIYIPQTGHNLSGSILHHWSRYGAESTYGWPVSEKTAIGDRIVQFFEHVTLANDPTGTEPTGVVALHSGTDWFHRQAALLGSLDRDFSETLIPWVWDVGMHPAMNDHHRDTGGVFAWGNPIDWAYLLDSHTLLQPFEKAVIIAPAGLRPEPLPIGRFLAREYGKSTSGVAPLPGARLYDPERLRPSYGPLEGRWVDVDLTRQRVIFHSTAGPEFEVITSSGKDGFFTPPGRYLVNRKVKSEQMTGLWGTQEFYYLDNVYNTIYFTWEGHALHYAYWHDDFGTRRSHGCLNMRLPDSAYAFDFCQVGTQINIHY